MSGIERFEDIKAWQRARDLAKRVYDVTCQRSFAKDYALRDQIRRASVSVMSNIAEGYARQTHKESVQFLHVALGSIAEVQSQLYLAEDVGYIWNRQFTEVYEMASEAARLTNGLTKYLRKTNQ